MGISAGLLNERIRVLKEIHVVSEYGDQDIQYKEKFWCRARHLDKEGTRTEVNNEIFYTNNKQFEVRIYQDIKDTDIIQFYDQFYRIINISPDRPNQRKIITVEIINSFDFPIDAKPVEDEVIPTPDPEPDPEFTPEEAVTFVYHGLEFCVKTDYHHDIPEGVQTVILVSPNADGRFPDLNYSGNIVIPDQFEYAGYTFRVIGISKNAFEGTDVISVVIPDTIVFWQIDTLVPKDEKPHGTFQDTWSLVSLKIYDDPNIPTGSAFYGLFGAEYSGDTATPKSSIKVIYVLPQLLNGWKEVFSNLISIGTLDLSYLIQPIQN